jgi:hypothetical protein
MHKIAAGKVPYLLLLFNDRIEITTIKSIATPIINLTAVSPSQDKASVPNRKPTSASKMIAMIRLLLLKPRFVFFVLICKGRLLKYN